MKLTKTQTDVLRAAARGELFRDETRYLASGGFRCYVRVPGGPVTIVSRRTVDALVAGDLVETGERRGNQRALVATFNGEIEALGLGRSKS